MSPTTGSGSERDYVQSIERGFAVLLAFDADLPNPSLAELAQRTGLSRPAVRRILLTLQRLGYVAGSGGRWSLTPRVLTIGQHYAATHGIVEIAQPHLLRVAERTGDSASLAQLDGIDVVYVARVNARRVLSLNVDIGTRLPVHATSTGRVLVAFAASAVVDRVIEETGLPALTAHTITDSIVFRDALHHVRRTGYALVDSELEDGFVSAAVPIRDSKGAVVAALASSTSRGRRTPEDVEREVVPVLLEVAEDIGRDLELVLSRPRVLTSGPRDGFF
ncbi:IclR family transcriptional regulator [Nocardioides gansuensis]|uniref:IclR family transcriptional regulator n=1 Tax=Nocardioides gansuensis TaxID=2138300 RepID=A0A2T8F4K4_9ACTN|nr:IclR family transcriptional regulator C-terminal domain-containing protein [Nocardioides gansuensis]PVG80642.1 IclR family transcriptional regulator [Nocardioides gansuensis]